MGVHHPNWSGTSRCGLSGWINPAVWGVPNALKRESKSEVAHKWADCLHYPCRRRGTQCITVGDKLNSAPQLGMVATLAMMPRGPQRFKTGGKIMSGPEVALKATSPLPSRGSPTLQREGQNHQWPTSGHIGYITPAGWAVPNASERETKLAMAHTWAWWLHHPWWLHKPSRLGGPRRFRVGEKINSGRPIGTLATSPVQYGGPTLQSKGQNQQWPTCGPNGYITPAV